MVDCYRKVVNNFQRICYFIGGRKRGYCLSHVHYLDRKKMLLGT